jgi:hypothetical protein
MPKVKVPVRFSGTEGFPARRDARIFFLNRRFVLRSRNLRQVNRYNRAGGNSRKSF